MCATRRAITCAAAITATAWGKSTSSPKTAGHTLVFIEVKTRTTAAYGLPCEAVERNKRRKITRVASAYLAQFDLWERPCRFDVIEVWPDDQGEPVIRHLVHAFQAERR